MNELIKQLQTQADEYLSRINNGEYDTIHLYESIKDELDILLVEQSIKMSEKSEFINKIDKLISQIKEFSKKYEYINDSPLHKQLKHLNVIKMIYNDCDKINISHRERINMIEIEYYKIIEEHRIKDEIKDKIIKDIKILLNKDIDDKIKEKLTAISKCLDCVDLNKIIEYIENI